MQPAFFQHGDVWIKILKPSFYEWIFLGEFIGTSTWTST
jgi:hypothetical protein